VRARVRHGPDDGPPTWTLARLRAACPALGGYSPSGVWRLLRRLRVRLRRGRPRLFSPDPDYAAKEDYLLAVLDAVSRSAGRLVVLFADEVTYHHWPLPGREWCSAAGPPPQANRAAPGERNRRIVAALNALDARVHYREDRAIGHGVFCAFLEQLARAYPTVERIILILDNWPVHLQPEVLATAQRCHIELVFLPTYAPWLNPIEKLWDALKEDVLRQQRMAGYWKEVQREVRGFLDRFAEGSPDLLYRVGLLGDGMLATALHPIT
jgi:hypothetical protein